MDFSLHNFIIIYLILPLDVGERRNEYPEQHYQLCTELLKCKKEKYATSANFLDNENFMWVTLGYLIERLNEAARLKCSSLRLTPPPFRGVGIVNHWLRQRRCL